MAKKTVLPAALAESIKSSIHSLEVQVNLLKQAIGGGVAEDDEDDGDDEPAPKKGKKAAPAKKGKAKDDEEEFDLDDAEEDEEDDSDDGDDDADEEDADDGDDEHTLDSVTKAFQKFAGKSAANKTKAKAILKKLKVSSLRDIKEKDFQKALDLLEAA